MSNNETIEGRESPNRQCYECVNCIAPDDGFYTQCRRGSCFKCRFLDKNYTTWHMDVPKECPCKGAGWHAKKSEKGRCRMERLIDYALFALGIIVMWFVFGGWLLALLGGCGR